MKICCQTKTQTKKKVRVKIIKAPLVNSADLKKIVLSRAKAVVL